MGLPRMPRGLDGGEIDTSYLDPPFNDLRDALPTYPGRPFWNKREMFEIHHLVIHHTATGASITPRQIHDAQMNRNYGTAQRPAYPPRITYHGLISSDGWQWKVNAYSSVVWAAPGFNRSGVHLCLIGNFQIREVPLAQYLSLLHWMSRIVRPIKLGGYGIDLRHVYRHGDVVPTLCPGKYFPSTTHLRADLKAYMA